MSDFGLQTSMAWRVWPFQESPLNVYMREFRSSQVHFIFKVCTRVFKTFQNLLRLVEYKE